MSLLWLWSWEGRFGRARSTTAAVRAVHGRGHTAVTCPEPGPVFPWVCAPELPVWGESFQTFVNSLKHVGYLQGFGLLWCLPWGVTLAEVAGARQS